MEKLKNTNRVEYKIIEVRNNTLPHLLSKVLGGDVPKLKMQETFAKFIEEKVKELLGK